MQLWERLYQQEKIIFLSETLLKWRKLQEQWGVLGGVSRMPCQGDDTCEHQTESMDISWGGLSARSNCTGIKALVLAAVSSLFSLGICHQLQVLLKAAFACHSVLHAQVIIYISGVISLPRSSVGRTLSLPAPLLFFFKTKQIPSREFRECFFFQLRKSQGLLSKPLVSALGLAAMCSISQQLSPVTENVPQPLGQQLGWAMQGWDPEPEQRRFLYKWGTVFWMNIEGEFPGCVLLFLQGNNSWAELLLLHPEQRGFGQKSSLQPISMRQGSILAGVMVWYVVEEALVILQGWCFPGPPSLKVLTRNKTFFACISHWHFPAFPTATSWILVWFSHSVFRNGCVMSPECHLISGLSLCGPSAPPAVSLLGQPESPWETHTVSAGPELLQNLWPA